MLRFTALVGLLASLTAAQACAAAVKGDWNTDIATLRANLIQWYAGSAPAGGTIDRYIEALGQTGTWPDIDYTDTDRGAWQPRQHLLRVLDMARAYAKVGHPLAGSPRLQAAIETALAHWVREDYQNANWWFGRIGVPLSVAPMLVLMGDDLEPQLRDRAITQLLGPSTMGMTGQNKVWLAGIALIKGVLIEDPDLIGKAKTAIFEELRVTTQEGIQSDFSFHQHGPQQQWGNYGAGFGGDMLQWAAIFKGTDGALSPEQLDLLARYFLEGPAWVLWKGRMDISGCGRQIFRGSQLGKGRSMMGQLKLLGDVVSPESETYQRIMASNVADARNTLIGNKHFWRSDITVHRRPSWYASVKMCSTRVIGAETCNGENLLGLHLADGVTYYLRTGTEYEDLFPVWDWRRLPGITCRQGAGSLKPSSKRCRGRSDFAGGVSDGVCGVAAMEYIRDGLQARKAWFFLDDAVVCLGAGITCEQPEPVVTSVNQCALHGPVVIDESRQGQTLTLGNRLGGRLNWVHHDGIGYVFLGAEEATVNAITQSGDWHDVHHREPNNIVARAVLNLWIDHGTRPRGARYAYVVLPDVTIGGMPARRRSLDVTVLEQSDLLLAVSSRGGRLLQGIFFEPGQLVCDEDLSIRVDAPCVVMLDRTVSPARFHLADPTHKRETISVSLSGRSTNLEVALPHDGLAGRTVSLELQLPAK